MGRRPRLRLFALLPLALAAGCLSPTLPLPPPDRPDDMQPLVGSPDTWVIAGPCLEGALVTVFNENTGVGAVVEDRDRDGHYEIEIVAKRCDLAWVVQAQGEEGSSRTSFVIQELTPSGPVDPSACK
jgi:hypothetical protein